MKRFLLLHALVYSLVLNLSMYVVPPAYATHLDVGSTCTSAEDGQKACSAGGALYTCCKATAGAGGWTCDTASSTYHWALGDTCGASSSTTGTCTEAVNPPACASGPPAPGCQIPDPPVNIAVNKERCINNIIYKCTAPGTVAQNDCAPGGTCTNSTADAAAGTITCDASSHSGPEIEAKGQWIPQAGYNCGVPVAPGQTPTTINKCCYTPVHAIQPPASFGWLPVVLGAIPGIGTFASLFTTIFNVGVTNFDELPYAVNPGNIKENLNLATVKDVKTSLKNLPACSPDGIPSGEASADDCICTSPPLAIGDLCSNVSSTEYGACKTDCIDQGGIYTGIGCIRVATATFVQDILGVGVGISGAFAMLCIFYSVYMIQTSQGNPEKVNKGRELITSCITGILMVIFSIFILRLIGYDILRIPGFSN